MNKKDILKIIDIELEKLFERINSLGYKVELTKRAKEYVAEKGFDEKYGARPLNRAIQKYLEDALAEEILKGELSEGDIITADYPGEGESLVISVKKQESAS